MDVSKFSLSQLEQLLGKKISGTVAKSIKKEFAVKETDDEPTMNVGAMKPNAIGAKQAKPSDLQGLRAHLMQEQKELAASEALLVSLNTKAQAIKDEIESLATSNDQLESEIKDEQKKAEESYAQERSNTLQKARSEFKPEVHGDFNAFVQVKLAGLDFGNHTSTLNSLVSKSSDISSGISLLGNNLSVVQASISKTQSNITSLGASIQNTSSQIQTLEAQERAAAAAAAQASHASSSGAQLSQGSSGASGSNGAVLYYRSAEGIAETVENSTQTNWVKTDVQHDEQGRVSGYKDTFFNGDSSNVSIQYHGNNVMSQQTIVSDDETIVIKYDENGIETNRHSNNVDGRSSVSVGDPSTGNKEFHTYETFYANGNRFIYIEEKPNDSGGMDREQIHCDPDGSKNFHSNQVLDSNGQMVREVQTWYNPDGSVKTRR